MGQLSEQTPNQSRYTDGKYIKRFSTSFVINEFPISNGYDSIPIRMANIQTVDNANC